MSQVQADFDRIALLDNDEWDHNRHYHAFLLKFLPPHSQAALDIGCGTGAFARLLADHADRVDALDLSPQMIRIGQERSASCPNIHFQVADFMACDLPAGAYDIIASIATLHHLPLDAALLKIKAALRPGGYLLVIDLHRAAGPADIFRSGFAFPVNLALRLLHTGRLRTSPAVRAAWDEHGQHDSYLTVPQVRDICAALLPGARVRQHLLWRYSLVWKKPE
jgi:SAM-dependent methyltransferase